MDTSAQVTQLLNEVAAGHDSAADRLFPLVYEDLRSLARSFFAAQRPDHTLEPTALVHEAFVRLVDRSQVNFEGRAHFFATAARAMRQILINHAEAKSARKRGRGWQQVTLDGALAERNDFSVDLLALNDALKRLEQLDERQARVIELRFFARMTLEEAASVLDVSPRTVGLDWRMARAWLLKELDGAGS